MIFLCQNRFDFAKLNTFLYIPHRICYVENNNKLILNDIVAVIILQIKNLPPTEAAGYLVINAL